MLKSHLMLSGYGEAGVSYGHGVLEMCRRLIVCG